MKSLKDKLVFPLTWEEVVGGGQYDELKNVSRSSPGMTLREYYAGLALAGLVSWQSGDEKVKRAVKLADDLIAELERED